MSNTKIVTTVSALALALTLTACSGSAEQPPGAASTTPAASQSASPSPSASASSPSADEAWENSVAFAESVADADFKTARTFVAPGSTAARYLDYQESARKAHAVNGVELPHGPSTVTEPNENARTIALLEDGKTTSTWKSFEYDADGKVTTWVGRKPLEETIASKVTHGKGGGQALTLLGANAPKDGNLYVVVEIAATKDTSVDSAPSYVASDGIRRTASGFVAPTEVEAGTKAIAMYQFDGTELGGTLTYETWADNFNTDTKIKIKVG